MPSGREFQQIAGVRLPALLPAPQLDPALQNVDRRLARVLVFGQLHTGLQRHHGLAEVAFVSADDRSCRSPGSGAARGFELLAAKGVE
jgi:hypothetical protein